MKTNESERLANATHDVLDVFLLKRLGFDMPEEEHRAFEAAERALQAYLTGKGKEQAA